MILNRSNDLSSESAANIETVEFFSTFVSVDPVVVITLTSCRIYLSIKSRDFVFLIIKYAEIGNSLIK